MIVQLLVDGNTVCTWIHNVMLCMYTFVTLPGAWDDTHSMLTIFIAN